jgi:nucleoid-associated protein YgaU
MPKNSQAKSKKSKTERQEKIAEQKNSFWDIFKFGESYTSLILGIIVVIVATITLITFVKGKDNVTKLTEGINETTLKAQEAASESAVPSQAQNLPKEEHINPTKIADKVDKTSQKEVAKKPTLKPTVINKQDNKIAAANDVAKKDVTKNEISGSQYIVVGGDTLWDIAEKKYKSGYNWVDIQKANKLTNANQLNVGQKLTLPSVKAKIATTTGNEKQMKAEASQTGKSDIQAAKISGNNYTVVRGDSLWDISVRAYGDGYEWPKIAAANKMINPRLIHAGNKLNIPRG